jgi:hypothetical protein
MRLAFRRDTFMRGGQHFPPLLPEYCLVAARASHGFTLFCGLGGAAAIIWRSARVSAALSPANVIRPIEGDDHQTRGLALAGELMRHVARHHGKPAWPEPRGGMINHLSEDGAANDDQLLFRSMGMPWNHASGRRLQDPRRGTGRRIPGLDCRRQAFHVVIRRKLNGLEGLHDPSCQAFGQRRPAGEDSDACHQCPNKLLFHTAPDRLQASRSRTRSVAAARSRRRTCILPMGPTPAHRSCSHGRRRSASAHRDEPRSASGGRPFPAHWRGKTAWRPPQNPIRTS